LNRNVTSWKGDAWIYCGDCGIVPLTDFAEKDFGEQGSGGSDEFCPRTVEQGFDITGRILAFVAECLTATKLHAFTA
jgi:hypothetical protein